MAVIKERVQLAAGKETTWGTAATRNVLLPFTSFSGTNEANSIIDNAIRGIPARDYQAFRGGESSRLQIEGWAYREEIGHLLMAITGTDTVSGTGTYTHTFSVSPTPPSYTFEEDNVLTTYIYPGCYAEELTLRFSVADSALTYSATFRGKKKTTGTKTTLTPSITPAFLGRQASITLNGSSNTHLIEAEVTLRRPVNVVYLAQDTTDVGALVVGPLEVTGRATFEWFQTNEYAAFLNNNQGNFELLFTQDVNNSLKITMGKVYMESGELDRNRDYITVAVSFRGLYVSTDGGPIKFELKNNRNTAY